MSDYDDAVMADEPLAYWPLDDAEGSFTVRNLASTAWSGIATNVTLGVPGGLGDHGTAAQFDGATSWLSLPTGLDGPQPLPYTFEFWCTPADPAPVGLFDTAPNDLSFRNYPEGQFGLVAESANPLGALDATCHHLVFVVRFDIDHRVIDYYLDNILVGSFPGTVNDATITIALPMVMGNINGGALGWYEGTLQKFAVYPQALSPDRIAVHFTIGRTVAPPIPIPPSPLIGEVPVLRTFLPRLFDSRELTDALNRDPQAAPGITIEYWGGGVDTSPDIDEEGDFDTIGPAVLPVFVTIRHYHMLTVSVDGQQFCIDLSAYPTLADLVNDIGAVPGYVVSLTPGADPETSPLALIDTDRFEVGNIPQQFQVSTSILHAIMRPVAWALEDAYDNVEGGLAETNPSTADGRWVDVWGGLLGNVQRQPGESDEVYSTRLVKEVFRQRLTPLALQLILQQDTGIEGITATGDLYDEAFIVGVSLVGTKILLDRLHNRTIFFVSIPTSGDPATDAANLAKVTEIVNRNSMAGMLPVISIV